MLKFASPVACTYGKRCVTNLKHEVFFDCPPYEWRSRTSDGLFLPIYPPRSMRVVLGFWWLVDFCNKYVSSLWLMLSPWIIRTLTLPPLLASLITRTFRRYHTPTIYLPQNSHHTYLSWHFHSHSEIYFHATFHRSIHMTHITFFILLFAWTCSWHCICGKATVHNFHTCHSWFIAYPSTPPEAFI